MRLFALFVFLFCGLAFGCGDEESSGEENERLSTESPDLSQPSPGNYSTSPLFPWVDRLNLRNAPRTDAEVVARLDAGMRLQPSGNQSPQTDAIVLRSVLYEEPWYEVTTPDGQTGWVFGGAVKTEGEPKGNEPITDEVFNFPIFGDFNLSEWTSMGVSDDDGEGDFDRLARHYRNGQLRLTIESYDGEYGCGYDYTLRNDQGVLLKKRSFAFSNMTEPIEMTEVVIDYKDDPAIRYFRSQTSPRPYQQLNARPLMVNGDWSSEPVGAATEETPDLLGLLSDIRACPRVFNPNSPTDGCDCSFRREKTNYDSQVFAANIAGTDACVVLRDETVALTGYWDDYFYLEIGQPWILLEDERALLFGQYADFGNRERIVERLTNALLSQDPIPAAVPISNQMTGGMMVREVRDLATEALDRARELRSNGEERSRAYFDFQGGGYRVVIHADEDPASRSDSGTDYTGRILVFGTHGSLVYEGRVYGQCGC